MANQMAIEWDALWQQLNARQRHFLMTLSQAEQDRAVYFHSQRAMFDPLKKGAEWRWLVHNPVGGGGLQDKLDEAARQAANQNTSDKCSPDEKLVNNQGSGSTYKALEQYGYLDRRWETVEAYSVAFGSQSVAVLSVRLTARGRKLANMMLAKAISAETTLNGPAGKPELSQVRDDLKKKATRRLEKLRHQGKPEVEGRSEDEPLPEAEGQSKTKGTAYFSPEDWEDLSKSSARTVCASCGLEARVDALARVRDRISGAALADTCPAFRELVLQQYEERVARPCFLMGKGWLNLRALSQAVRAKRASRAFGDVFQETGLNLVQVDQGWPPLYASEFEHICAWLGASAEAFVVPAPPDAGTLNDRRRGFYVPEYVPAASEN